MRFFLTLLFSLNLFCNLLYAQYGQGGTPYSFQNNLRGSFPQNIKNVILPSFDLISLQEEDAVNDQSKGPFRFGYNHDVNLSLTNSGTWQTLPNGDRLWQLLVKSPGALSINLAFNDFFMPPTANLFIYSADKSYVIGAFTDLNNQKDSAFATDIILGDAVILEYYEPVAVVNQGRLNLFRVTHGYRGVEDYLRAFDSSGACQKNINCNIGEGWQKQKNSVVFIITTGNTICSGALVNDVPQDSKPYILTANHCDNPGYGTWVFRFNWEAPTCQNPPTSPPFQSLTGAVRRAKNPGSDMLLMEIIGGLVGQTIPASYHPYFSGWSSINTPATKATCIHHPNGDIKKISRALNSTLSTTFSVPKKIYSADCWRVGKWTTGCTEPGSSGSPLYDQNKRIVGQLAGGPSSCGASDAFLYDSFGKFATSWLGVNNDTSTQLKHWLDPDNTGIQIMDGTDSLVLSVPIIKAEIVSFNIYPNPNNGEFNIEIKLSQPHTIIAKIYNLLGEVVYVNTFLNASNGLYNLNLSSQPNGIYFLEVSSQTERSVKKINVIR